MEQGSHMSREGGPEIKDQWNNYTLKPEVFKTLNDGSDSLLVTLYIEDVNDHPPVFVGDPYQVTVDELTPKGMVIYDGIMAKDKDKANTANSDIYYWISNGNENLKFSLSPLPRGGAAVVLEKPFDFENGDREMNLTITASDRGAPARLSRAQLTISVKDGDDQPPLFTAAIYRASVTEYPGPQMRSLQLLLRTEPPILAYDGDLAIDQRLNYRIRSGNTGQHFSMDSATGALTLVKTFDREQLENDEVTLTVEAWQTDDRSRSARATVVVTVTDLNDNRPDFLVDRYNISIIENLLRGFSIVQVRATDADKGDNANFTYSLDDPSGAFGLNPVTGWLTVADQSKLDREEQSQLKLDIYADELTPSVLRRQSRSFTKVIINLLDSNDNNPKFLPTNTYQFVVDGNSSLRRVIGRVEATDPDEGVNGRVTFSFENNTLTGGQPAFSISSSSGELRQRRPLQAGSYVLFVRAEDAPVTRGETRSALAVVTVLVRVRNVRPPSVPPGQRLWVGKDVTPGSRVGQLIVEDPDGDDLTFRLRNATVPFDVDNDTGVIRVSSPLDETEQSKYSLGIDITDGTHLTTSIIDILIVPENAEESFESASLAFNVTENLSNITVGMLLDEDERPVEFLEAKILNPSLNDTFQVTSEAELRLIKSLDFEEHRQLSFTVVLQYRRHRQHHVRAAALTVNVLDANDNAPRFSSRHYTGVVAADAAAGDLATVTPAIRVSDADEVRSELEFRLTGCEGAFEVSALALVSVVATQFEREVFECELEVTDEDGLRSNSSLTVRIEDWEPRRNPDVEEVTELTPRAASGALKGSATGTTIRSVGLASKSDLPVEDPSASTHGRDENETRPDEGGRRADNVTDRRDFRSRALSESSQILAQLLTSTPGANASDVLRATVRIPSGLPTGSVVFRLPESISLQPLPAGRDDNSTDGGDVTEVWPGGGEAGKAGGGRHFAIDFEKNLVRVVRPLRSAGQVVLRIQSQEGSKRKDLLILMVDVVLVKQPELVKHNLTFSMDEGEYTDVEVGTVQLTTSPESDRVLFSIPSGDSSYRITQDGRIFLSGKVDSERSTVARVPILACRQLCIDLASSLPLEGSVQDACRGSCAAANVTLLLRDLNDNSPVFTGVSDVVTTSRGLQNEPDAPYAVYKIRTPTELVRATVVANVSAYDIDSDSTNSAVRFKILTPSDDFVIGAETGTVTAARNVTSPAGTVLRLTLAAYDLGSPSQRAFAVLELTATEGSQVEMARAFDRRLYEVHVEENTRAAKIWMPWRLDPSGQQRRWTVNPVNGTKQPGRLAVAITNNSFLEMSGPLDHEQTREVWLLVTTDLLPASSDAYLTPAAEGQPPSPRRAPPNSADRGSSADELRYNQALIKIVVVDVNDHWPRFNVTDLPSIVGVPYDAGYGFEVMHMEATDGDKNDNISYSLNATDRHVRAMYSIDPTNGQVWLLRRADDTAQRIHRLQILATDTANHTTRAKILIYVLDSRDMMIAKLNQTSEHIRQNRDVISRGLSEMAGGDVRILRVAPHSDGQLVDERYSDVWLYALDPRTRTLLSSRDLMARLGSGDPEMASGGDQGVRVAGMWPAVEESRGFFTNLKFIIIGLSLTIFLLMALTLGILCCKSCQRDRKTSPYPPLTMTPAASGYSTTPPPTVNSDVSGGSPMTSQHAGGRSSREMVEKRVQQSEPLAVVLQTPLYCKPSRRLSATQVSPGHYMADAKQLSQTLVRRRADPSPAQPSSHKRYGSLNYPAGSRAANQLAAVLNPERPLVGPNVRRQSVTNSLGDGTEVGVATMSFCSESPSDMPQIDHVKGFRLRPGRLAPSSAAGSR
ncbi:protocadherin-16-like [Pollicipes pollicipes]|uniref:protocadherin-16-like n=1 Tax=Pollicipes pollicipes TaxID=41117 RepID=UPI0018852FE5|nr:protocadherin-16-like [Pollicipes pollicipes]